MSSYLIKDTTVEERIELIKQWQEPDDCVGGSDMDLFDMYDAYIKGEKEISQINEEFQANYVLADAEPYVEKTEDIAGSAADEILKLKQLQEQGILTEEEFSAAKKKVLGI